MFSFKSFRRRLSIAHSHHRSIAVKISRNNNSTTYIFQLLFFTAIFAFFASVLIPPFFKEAFINVAFYVLPLAAFVVLWYVILLRLAFWRSFGIEEVVVENGMVHWTRTALFWIRRFDVPAKEITEVKSITPWHGLSNRVEFTALGKRRCIGDMLMRDEATELADQLRQAVGLLQ
jgi:hypothetical protein